MRLGTRRATLGGEFLYAQWLQGYLNDQNKSADGSSGAIWAFDESAGASTAVDVTGSHDLTYNGSPTLGASPLVDDDGTSVSMDGVDDYGESEDGGTSSWTDYYVDSSKVFTVGLWVKPGAITDEVDQLFGNALQGDDGLIILRESRSVVSADNAIRVIHETGGNVISFQSADGKLPDDTTAFVTVTGDGSDMRTYVDATLLSTDDMYSSNTDVTANVTVGAQQSGANSYQRHTLGDIDVAFTINHQLTGSEIQKIYDVGNDRANR